MDILTASRIAQNGQRISDPVQAQEIYQNLSNDANLRMKFLENHADILSGGVSFSGLSFAQDQEIESAKAEALKAQNEQIAKEYAQYVKDKPDKDNPLHFDTYLPPMGGGF